MKQFNSITDLCEIKDKNITFDDSKTLVDDHFIYFYATLDYEPPVCTKCQGTCIRFGFQKRSRLPYFPIFDKPTVIYLKKRRFQCQECQAVFVAQTPFVKANHTIPQDMIFKIGLSLKEGKPLTLIAKELHISASTVCRALKAYAPCFRQTFQSLPEVLSFDEVSIGKGQMGFVIFDPVADKVVDILQGRRKDDLINYFLKFNRKTRDKVKFITTDMYEPYIEVVNKLFRQAKLIFNRFHIVQNISREFLRVRIKIQNTYSRRSKEYRHIKRFWKILQHDSGKLSQERHYSRSFKRYLSSFEINDIVLNYDARLAYFYEVYQNFLFHFRRKEGDELFIYLKSWLKTIEDLSLSYDSQSDLTKSIIDLSHGFQRVIKTTIKYENYVRNALEYSYSNGNIEGFNNQIKTLQKTAYGFRNFSHYKTRILLRKNVKTTDRRIKRHQIQPELTFL